MYFRQYEASTKLLLSRDAPVNASKILESEAHEFQAKNSREALLLEVFLVHRPFVGMQGIQHVQHHAACKASQAGHQTWGSSSSSGYWQETDHWKTSWSSKWSHNTAWSSNDRWSQAPKEEEAESDDDAWGKWKAPKEPPKEQTEVPEPEAKRHTSGGFQL